MANFPPCPNSLKAIQHYLKTATEHDQRDPVVSYWARLFALQLGLKIDKKSDEAKSLLYSLMDWLETQKKTYPDNEAITNDIAAQAHLENYGLKLFFYADTQDRAGNFGKNVVKAFYTSGIIFDILQTFGELSDEISQNRKYAKWKATYIHNCLKNGETPVSGPMQQDDDETTSDPGQAGGGGGGIGFVDPETPISDPINPNFPSDFNPRQLPTQSSSDINLPDTNPYNPPTTPVNLMEQPETSENTKQGNRSLNPEQVAKAQKYCKWAASALNYDDIPTAIDNLKRGLKLLETGIDS